MDQEQSINKRVSIVIPVYNSHKTLPKCLDSMIAQTYQDLEIICVNDCSKDNSLEIIQEYQKKDSRVKLVNHTENMNAGGARNSGIKAATGTYVCFVDNDDWMTPDAMDILVKASSNFTADYIVCDWVDYFSDKEYFIKNNLPNNASRDDIIMHVCKNGIRMIGCLIRRELFFTHDLFYPEKIFYEDNAVAIPLIAVANKINYVDKALYYYYHSPSSVTGFTTLKKLKDRMITEDMLIKNLQRLNVYDQHKKQYDYYYSKLLAQSINLAILLDWKDGLVIVRDLSRKLDSLHPIAYINESSDRIRHILHHPLLTFVYIKIRLSFGIFRKVRFR